MLRWSALALGVLGFAMRLATTLWVHPLTWEMSGGLRLLVLAAAFGVAVGVLFGLFFLINRGGRRPRTVFTPGDRRLTAMPYPYDKGAQAILLMYLAGGLLPTDQVGGDSQLLTGLVLSGVFVAGAVAILWMPRPQLHLDREGLTIQRLFGSTRLAWDEIAPIDPVASSGRHIRVHLKSQTVAGPSIPVGWLDIDPSVLVRAIRHYAEHPEDRAAIGTGQLKASTL